MKTTKKKLNFEGCESSTSDYYYDICNGYYNNEIKDKYTKDELKKAVSVIEALYRYLEENDLIM